MAADRGEPVAHRPGLLLTGLAILPLLIWIAALLLVVLGAGLGIVQWGERPDGRG